LAQWREVRVAFQQAMKKRSLDFDPIAEARSRWEQRWGSEPGLAMAAVTSIMRVQQILLAEINAFLRPLGLNFPRYEALMLLSFSRQGALPLGKIGERLQVHPTSVTNIIDRLEADGFVIRSPHSSDRRTVLAQITPPGRRIAHRATRVLNEAAFVMSPYASKELEALVMLLRKLRIYAGDFIESSE
jgi:DNA-binding MarR family transcriptional regulator